MADKFFFTSSDSPRWNTPGVCDRQAIRALTFPLIDRGTRLASAGSRQR